MGQLCIYLPPFASDYSGVCSALFDLNCLAAINDASCCTAHYTQFDEPRWETQQRPVFSTQLRSTDMILGNDSLVVESITRAAMEYGAELVAVVGTPVPAITGMDMVGIAHEIEANCGVPALGFATTGFSYYDKGIVLAGRALVERFADDSLAPAPISRTVNVLGMTPLDYGDVGTDADVVESLEQAGWEVNASLFMGYSTNDVRRIPAASVNLAVSAAGLKLATWLKSRYGTPFVAGAPVGRAVWEEALSMLEAAASGSDVDSTCCEDFAGGGEAARTLIVGDQVMANSLRRDLQLRKGAGSVDVASFFTWSRKLAKEGDQALKSERDFIDLVRTGRYRRIICDPLIARCPIVEKLGMEHVDWVHPAVSSRLHWTDVTRYLAL